MLTGNGTRPGTAWGAFRCLHVCWLLWLGAFVNSSTQQSNAEDPASDWLCSASGVAQYHFQFHTQWIDPPPPQSQQPTWSWTYGASHSPCFTMWREGEKLDAKYPKRQQRGGFGIHGLDLLQTSDPGNDPVVQTVQEASIKLNRYYPLVSAITEIHPSPDWFVGIDSLSLCDGPHWIQQLAIPVYPYDSGWDSGLNFTSSNPLESWERERIAALTTTSRRSLSFRKNCSDAVTSAMGVYLFNLTEVDEEADVQNSYCRNTGITSAPTQETPTDITPGTTPHVSNRTIGGGCPSKLPQRVSWIDCNSDANCTLTGSTGDICCSDPGLSNLYSMCVAGCYAMQCRQACPHGRYQYTQQHCPMCICDPTDPCSTTFTGAPSISTSATATSNATTITATEPATSTHITSSKATGSSSTTTSS
eukprot:scpid82019/ scgid4464/ Spondin-2; Differentially expressed in cancerous and non-cancerous lung cells 1; Mindin